MKQLWYIITPALFLAAACSQPAQKTEESNWKNYGPVKVAQDDAISMDKLISSLSTDSTEQVLTIKGEIEEVCSKAGCWISVKKPDGKTIRVIFKDHFTIPTDTKAGTLAYLHGRAFWDTIPVDILQHYAEDAGKPATEIEKITKPEFELAFEADGITFEGEAKTEKK